MTGPSENVWREAMPELVIAAVTVVVTAVVAYAMAGAAGMVVVAVVTAAGALVVLRGLLPLAVPPDDETRRRSGQKPVARSISGYSQRRFLVSSSITYLHSYETGLRPVLEHLLAARLAERHGVNLYQDPAAARRLLCRERRDADLWQWIDPRRATVSPDDRRGIPRRTLTRLLNRLEQV
jgi:hypothetical protein